MSNNQTTPYQKTVVMFLGGVVFLGVGIFILLTAPDLSAPTSRGGPLWVIPVLLVASGGGLIVGGIVRLFRKQF